MVGPPPRRKGPRRFSDLSRTSRTVADDQVHDWLYLLGHEIEHIWRKNWSVGKVLYIITRYAPVVDTPLMTVCEPDPCVVGIGGGVDSDSILHSAQRSIRRGRR